MRMHVRFIETIPRSDSFFTNGVMITWCLHIMQTIYKIYFLSITLFLFSDIFKMTPIKRRIEDVQPQIWIDSLKSFSSIEWGWIRCCEKDFSSSPRRPRITELPRPRRFLHDCANVVVVLSLRKQFKLHIRYSSTCFYASFLFSRGVSPCCEANRSNHFS
jgi:hypothetical protein